MLDDTITHLIPIDISPSTAAAATTEAYDMEVETLTPQEPEGFTDSNRHCKYIRGGKHFLLLTNIDMILEQLDAPTQYTRQL